MTVEKMLKDTYNAYLSGQKSFTITYDDQLEDNNHIDQLRDDGVITVKMRTIGYSVISLTSIGLKHCEEIF